MASPGAEIQILMPMSLKSLISIFACQAFLFPAYAGNSLSGENPGKRDFPRFTFGVETSYVLTFLNYSHFNFISIDGGRRNERTLTASALSNGQILLSGGVNISSKLNLSIYTGYSGVYLRERMVPLSLRMSWYSGDDPMKNRWIAFCGLGAGFNDFRNFSKVSAEGKLGCGYRVSLNRSAKLDFLLAFQEIFTHPKAYESDAGNYVPAERLRRNNAFISAFTFGFALVF